MESIPLIVSIHTACTESVHSFLTGFDSEKRAIDFKTPLISLYQMAETKAAQTGFTDLFSIHACFGSRLMEYDYRTFISCVLSDIVDSARTPGSNKIYCTLFFVFRRPISKRTLGESRQECSNLILWMMSNPTFGIGPYTGLTNRYRCNKLFLPSR